DVLMPQLGESVTEGTLVKWLKQPGDQIALYEPICEISTDKVTAEVPATIAGTLQEILVEVGMTVAVGEPICHVLSADATTTAPKQALREARTSTVKRYSPAVLNLAAEHGLNLEEIAGSGVGGRITRRDVLAFLEGSSAEQIPVAPLAQPS